MKLVGADLLLSRESLIKNKVTREKSTAKDGEEPLPNEAAEALGLWWTWSAPGFFSFISQ